MSRSLLAAVVLLVSIVMPRAAAAQSTEPLNARALGMGGAFRALVYDGNAVELNPAGMAQAKRFLFEGGYFRTPPVREFGLDLSITDSLTNPSATGFAVHYRRRKAARDVLAPAPGIDEQRYAAAVGIPLIPEKLHLGMSTKFIRVTYPGAVPAQDKVNVITGDFGILYRPFQMLAVGATFDNLIDGGHREAPRAITGGVAVLPTAWLVLTADGVVDLATTEDEETGWAAGAQLSPTRNIAFRGGIYEEAISKDRYWTAGIGLLAETGAIDYAVRVPERETSTDDILTHLITLSFYAF